MARFVSSSCSLDFLSFLQEKTPGLLELAWIKDIRKSYGNQLKKYFKYASKLLIFAVKAHCVY